LPARPPSSRGFGTGFDAAVVADLPVLAVAGVFVVVATRDDFAALAGRAVVAAGFAARPVTGAARCTVGVDDSGRAPGFLACAGAAVDAFAAVVFATGFFATGLLAAFLLAALLRVAACPPAALPAADFFDAPVAFFAGALRAAAAGCFATTRFAADFAETFFAAVFFPTAFFATAFFAVAFFAARAGVAPRAAADRVLAAAALRPVTGLRDVAMGRSLTSRSIIASTSLRPATEPIPKNLAPQPRAISS
jgi:hypothetical protein